MILKLRSPSRIVADRRQRMRQWHPWFAWRPVRLNSFTVVWLQKVHRRRGHYGDLEYTLEQPA